MAAQAAVGGSDFIGTITNSADAVYLEMPGVSGPRDWLVGDTMGVLLSNKGWGAPSGFDTPLGRAALMSVTLLRASEAVTTSAWPACGRRDLPAVVGASDWAPSDWALFRRST